MGASVSGTARAVMLGLAAGSRSTLGSAPLWAVSGTGKRALMAVAALGEFSMDKAPGIPSRLAWPSLAARILSAGTGGALLARTFGEPVVLTAAVAAAASSAGVAMGTRWRDHWSGTGHPAWVGGVIEDACALMLAQAACRNRLGQGAARG